MKVFFFLYFFLSAIFAEEKEDDITNLTAPEIIQKHGYPVETHKVQTKAGYIVYIHRIPHGRNNSEGNPKKPILLQHGLFCSSANFILAGPEKGLGFVLADNGYDVWMPNARGNRYSKEHVNLTVEDTEYWDFSWHELGKDDMPDVIDYILQETLESDLIYIGHSQGTTSFWTFNIYNQDYVDKVKAMFAFAPIAYLGNTESVLFKFISQAEPLFKYGSKILGVKEFLPNDTIVNTIGDKFCKDTQPATPEICSNLLFLAFGFDEEQMNKTNLHAVLAHTPAGSSTKQVLHYAQSVKYNNFNQFDHGMFGNLAKYGSVRPPKYELNKVNVPVYLYYGLNDWLAVKPDLQKLIDQLPNIAKMYAIPFEKFNHGDFLLAKDVDKLVFKELLEDLAKLV